MPGYTTVLTATVNLKDITKSLLLITVISCCGSLQCGFNLWLVYSPSVIVKDFYNISFTEILRLKEDKTFNNFLTGITIALFPLGGTVGSIVVAPLTDDHGRKIALQANCIFSIIAAIMVACATVVQGYEFTMISRFASGVCSGIFYTAVPIYLSEISPTNLRGSVLLMPHLFLVIGLVMAQILALREVLGNQEGWPILKGSVGILALCQAIALLKCPESPRYLLIQKRDEENARKVLKKLRNKENVEDEIDELHQEDIAEAEEKCMNPLKLLNCPTQRQQAYNAIALACGQQLAGITAAYQYTEKIYTATKIGLDNVRFMSIFTSLIILLEVFILLYIITVVERKILLLFGLAVCCFCCGLLTVTIPYQNKLLSVSYVGTIAVNLFLVAHAIGPGAVPNVLTAEMFLQSSRSSGYVIHGFMYWLIHFITSVVYLNIEAKLKGFTFLFFIPFCIASFIYILKFIPETNNKTFLEIRNAVQKTEDIKPIVT